jgi:hypothetical protein
MSDWTRTTKEIPFASLPPEMVSAIHKHIEQHTLAPILSDALTCLQTNSTKNKRGVIWQRRNGADGCHRDTALAGVGN